MTQQEIEIVIDLLIDSPTGLEARGLLKLLRAIVYEQDADVREDMLGVATAAALCKTVEYAAFVQSYVDAPVKHFVSGETLVQ